MIKVVLLDLDDTLLEYPHSNAHFIQQYLESLEDFFQTEYGITGIKPVLIKGVQASGRDLDPTRMNEDYYWSALAATFGKEQLPTLRAGFDRFYAEIYPHLHRLVKPIEQTAPLIKQLLAKDYMVVIATNPFYPRTAIDQRLEWGGLDPSLFARVTHAQNSHFTKPHPHYYTEILAHLNCEPDEAVMVGDHWTNDMAGAVAAGLYTFWIANPHTPQDATFSVDAAGTLADFTDCVVAQGWLENLPPKAPQASQMAPRLLGNIGALFGTIYDIPARYWTQHPDPQEWSPLEIINHLLHYERTVQRPILEMIVAEDNPFIRASKAPPQPGELDLDGADGHELARQFAAERQLTLDFLAILPPEAWSRPARHSIYGPTNLLEMTVFASRHDLLHIRQLCQTIGRCE